MEKENGESAGGEEKARECTVTLTFDRAKCLVIVAGNVPTIELAQMMVDEARRILETSRMLQDAEKMRREAVDRALHASIADTSRRGGRLA